RVDDRDPRLRQVRHRTEPFDHVVQLRRLIALDDLRARRRQCELVGREVLEEGESDDDQDQRDEADIQDVEEDDCKDDVEKPEQRAREEHSQRQTGVATVRPSFHRESLSLEARLTRPIVAATLVAAAALHASPTAGAARPRIYVQAPGTIPAFVTWPAAFGLFVPCAR